MCGRSKERERSAAALLNISLCRGRGGKKTGETEDGSGGREIERVKRKYVTLGWVPGLGDGEGASLFYFRLTRLCAPFLSVAPSLFHTMLFFLLCPRCSLPPPFSLSHSLSLTPLNPPPSPFSVTFLRDAPRRKKRT